MLRIISKSHVFHRKINTCLRSMHRLEPSETSVSTSKNTKEPDLDAPIQYSKTAALKWRASESRTGKESNRLWYEPHVVFGSVMVFLIYFSVLREENDIDQELKRSLYSRIDGLEDAQRKQSLGFNQISRGRETSEIINQLNEVENGNKKKNV